MKRLVNSKLVTSSWEAKTSGAERKLLIHSLRKIAGPAREYGPTDAKEIGKVANARRQRNNKTVDHMQLVDAMTDEITADEQAYLNDNNTNTSSKSTPVATPQETKFNHRTDDETGKSHNGDDTNIQASIQEEIPSTEPQ